MYKVRLAKENEAKTIIDIHNKGIVDTFKNILDDNEINRIIEDTENRIINMINLIKHNEVCVLIEKGNIIGFSTFGKSLSKIKNVGEIYDIFILKDKQGKKGGYFLFMESCKYILYKKVIVKCFVENDNCGFYEKLNGKILKEIKTKYGNKYYKEKIYIFDNLVVENGIIKENIIDKV